VYIVDENGMDSSNTGGPSNSGELAWKEAIKKILAFDGHVLRFFQVVVILSSYLVSGV
jgi:hypothetical protein